MLNERQKLILDAKLAKLTNQHVKVIQILKHVINTDPKISIEELCMLNAAYKCTVEKERVSKALKYFKERHLAEYDLSDSGSEAEKSPSHLIMLNEIAKVEQGICDLCHEFIKLITDKLIPNSISNEHKMICNKFKGDYYCILLEFTTGKAHKLNLMEAEMSYIAASFFTTLDEMEHEERFSLNLNYALFCYYELSDPEQAYMIADTGYYIALSTMDKLDVITGNGIGAIAKILKEYMNIWQNQR
ncbi:DNA damage checkpoint protein rad24-like [Teleopsis dalmanni]|uniref:DNA damage checkpoint protein rad24-like n=1 Tax=Teleopsis dalmanni TaxID=139649 RepID=UPI0018CE10B0|nr:DNA damage checkpoint protein rad24-like [Teleopsis dalmanni]